MITLTIGNSYSNITGLTPEQEKQLRKLMSYKVNANAAYFSGRYRDNLISLLGKRGDFATGLLYIIYKYLESVPLTYIINDNRIKPQQFFLGRTLKLRLEHVPYIDQTNASLACERSHRGIVSAVTASGKSVMIALTINKIQVRTLVVVPSVELKDQLTKDFVRWFGINRVGKSRDICVENVQALDTKKIVTDYDCVIIDEFHHSASKSYRQLNKHAWKNIYYRFGFTATAYRSDDNEQLLLESVLSEVIYELDYHTAVKRGYIVPIEAYFVEVPKIQVEGYTWAQVYSEIIVNNLTRNEIILKLLDALKDKSTLCLVKEIAHGKKLVPYCFMSGQDEDSRDYLDLFNREEIKTLVGTVGVLGEGINTKPAEYGIIAGLGKSKNQFVQQVGRLLRKHKDKQSGKVIIFKDSSHRWSLEHFRAQVKVLKEIYGVVPIKITI